MTENVVGANLERLRVKAKLTQDEVAQKAGLSRLAYRKIEKGQSEPREGTLNGLATAVGVTVRELVTPVERLQGARFRSKKKMRLRDTILADVAAQLADYAELEDLLEKPRTDVLAQATKDLDVKSHQQDRAVVAARHVRRFLLGNRRADEPIFNICGLLENHGIKVITVNVASDEFFGLSVNNKSGPAVVVNEWERISVERRIFTAAHELGHLILHLGSWSSSVTTEPEDEETEANAFAAEFLMPQEQFAKEWRRVSGLDLVDAVLKIKQVFRVSYQSVLYRLGQQNPAARQHLWPSFYARYEARYGHSLRGKKEPMALDPTAFKGAAPEPSKAGEPDTLPEANFKEDRLSGLVREALDEKLITMSRAAEILRISLPDMRARAASWME